MVHKVQNWVKEIKQVDFKLHIVLFCTQALTYTRNVMMTLLEKIKTWPKKN